MGKYYQPFDQPSVPDASYQNGDAELGIPGSIADARAWEWVQRELQNAFVAAGLTPSFVDLTQLTQAVPILASASVAALVITTAVTKTVYGAGADFADLNAAFEWASQRRISRAGSLLFQLHSGQNTFAVNTTWGHPDGERITVQGATMSGVFPTYGSLTFTGNSSGQRAADTAANLTLCRARWATELRFTGGTGAATKGNINFNSILFTADGGGSAIDLMISRMGVASFTTCGFVGASGRGLIAAVGGVNCNNVIAFGNNLFGVGADDGGNIAVQGNLISVSNASHGVSVASATSVRCSPGTALYASANGGAGINATYGGVVIAPSSTINTNASSGVIAQGGANVSVASSTIGGNGGYACSATSNGFIDASSTGDAAATNTAGSFHVESGGTIISTSSTVVGALTPAANTIGNGNAINVV